MDSDQRNLNSFVAEYLRCSGFHKTVKVFNEELSDKSTGQNLEISKNTEYDLVMKRLLSYFDNGNFKDFFILWNDSFHLKKDNVDLIELTFLLHIYFALYPIKYDVKDIHGAMEGLNQFLSANGDFLSNSKDTISYFALPYVSNLKQHLTYSHLFKDEWTDSLKRDLQQFLYSHPNYLKMKPKLLELYHFYQNASKSSNDSGMQFSYLLKDYNEILETTADLIDLLETAARGDPITQKQVEQVTRRLFHEEALSGTDITRPGTAARTLRDSVVFGHVANKNFAKTSKKRELDYKKINNDLAVGDDKKKCMLFHALRWNLIESSPEDRLIILQEYLSYDILQCVQRQSKSLARMLNGDDGLVKLSFVQLLSALASFPKGRDYIAKKESMIEILIKFIQSRNFDKTTKECLLGCLQRLSLRKNIQMLMIERNMIEWLVNELASNNESSLVVENGIILLTNLCLTDAGRNKSSEIAPKILGLISDLLQSNQTPDSMSCIIGTLYSILFVKSTKEVALKMGLLEMLRESKDSAEIEKHKKYVISRLTSSQDDNLDSIKEDENDDGDDDNDDEDGNISEEYCDFLCSYPEEFSCEQLLNSEYARQSTQETL